MGAEGQPPTPRKEIKVKVKVCVMYDPGRALTAARGISMGLEAVRQAASMVTGGMFPPAAAKAGEQTPSHPPISRMK